LSWQKWVEQLEVFAASFLGAAALVAVAVASAAAAFGREAKGLGIVDRVVVAVAGGLGDREWSIYSHSLGDCTLAEGEVVAGARAGPVDSLPKSEVPGQNPIEFVDIQG
jgi:hypothetical protein